MTAVVSASHGSDAAPSTSSGRVARLIARGSGAAVIVTDTHLVIERSGMLRGRSDHAPLVSLGHLILQLSPPRHRPLSVRELLADTDLNQTTAVSAGLAAIEGRGDQQGQPR